MTSEMGSMTQRAAARPRKRRKGSRAFRSFIKNPRALTGVVIFGIFILIAIFAPLIAPYDPQSTDFMPNAAPNAQHWFGTTNTGQDIFSQFIWGTRTTLTVGVGAAIISTLIAILVGVYAGLMGGVTDSILNMLSNIFLVLPGLALLILIESYVKNTTPLLNGLIIALTGWAWGARVFRSVALSLANRDFIVAARLSGAGSIRIMFAEILPNMTSIISGNLIYSCLGAILAESSLAFLGFENVSSNSWGMILFWAQNNGGIMAGAWWWFVPPGLAIALVGTSLTLMNFAIDQITNPRLNVRKRKKVNALRKGVQSNVHQSTSA
jgi:peptide/nickel transport system permease protein